MGDLKYDRDVELRVFDETRAGVKGLFDAGITELPRIFIHPEGPFDVSKKTYHGNEGTFPKVPIIDLSGIGTCSTRRREIINELRDASEKWGLFQVINHGMSTSAMEEIYDGVRRFFEQDDELKRPWYTRDMTKTVMYNSNFNLYTIVPTNWRDTLMCVMAPKVPAQEDLPEACCESLIKYSKEVKNVGNVLLELLAEGLGLDPNYLKEEDRAEGLSVLCHYHPACPQPELAIGTKEHMDTPFIVVVLQDDIGGLQVLHQNEWVDVPPIPGGLVVNIGKLLQGISNDKYRSVEHRVLANRTGPRISVAGAFTTKSRPTGRHEPVNNGIGFGRKG